MTRSRICAPAREPLADIAKEKGLAARRPSRRSIAPAATRPAIRSQTLPERDALLAAAFNSDIGVDNEAAAHARRRLCLVRRDRHRSRPRQDLRRGPRRRSPRNGGTTRSRAPVRESARARRAHRQGRDGGGDGAAELGVPSRPRPTSPAAQPKDDLSADVVDRIFATPVGKAGVGVVRATTARAVFKVTAATVPPLVTDDPRGGRASRTRLRAARRGPARPIHRPGGKATSASPSTSRLCAGRSAATSGSRPCRSLPTSRFSRPATRRAKPALVRTTLVADLETPVAAFLKLRHERQGAAFLLESVEGGAVRGRYSMVGLDPDLIWRCRGRRRGNVPRAAEARAAVRSATSARPSTACAR